MNPTTINKQHACNTKQTKGDVSCCMRQATVTDLLVITSMNGCHLRVVASTITETRVMQ